MSLILLAGAALAADTIDSHGLFVPPSDGDVQDPLVTWRPEAQVAKSFGIDGLFEYADSPLVEFSKDPTTGTVTNQSLVSDLFALDLGASFAFHPRAAVTLELPVYLASAGTNGGGPAAGDLRLAVPVGLVLPGDRGEGFGLSVVPFLDAPTGAQKRDFAAGGFSGGGLAAAGYGAGAFAAVVDFGVDAEPASTMVNLKGGAHLVASASLGWTFTDAVAAHAEVRAEPHLGATNKVFPGAESPAEAVLSVRARTTSGLSGTLGASSALDHAVGAPLLRVFLGVGYSVGKNPPKDTDGDGILDKVDKCPTVPETKNGFEDTDGCPDELANVAIIVVGADNKPVAGAKVSASGQALTADDHDTYRLANVMPGTSMKVDASAPGYLPTSAELASLPPGATEKRITLSSATDAVEIKAHDADGKPVHAKITLSGPAASTLDLGDAGDAKTDLAPGDWVVLAEADGQATERRDLALPPGKAELTVLDIAMHPAQTVVAPKVEIKLLQHIQFAFNKADVLPESQPLLDEVAADLLAHPEIEEVEVQGHTDNVGGAKYNLDLSQRRVESVVKYLLSKGIAASRLTPKGYGLTVPLVPNDTEEHRAQNRRVQFIILKTAEEKKP